MGLRGDDTADLVGELRLTLGKLELALGAIIDAIVWCDEEGRIQWCNRSFESLVGKGRLEMLGARLSDLLPLEQKGEALRLETHPARCVLDTSESIRAFYEYRQGQRRKVLEISGAVAHMGAQRPSAVFVLRDVTESKEAEQALERAYAELKKMQRELIESEKLAALGRFASGLAHEVKNPLGIILSWAEFLERGGLCRDADAAAAIGHIKNSVKRADAIVRGLLQFARPAQLKKERARMEDLINDPLALLRDSLRLKNVAVETQWEGKAPLWVNADPRQMQQVFLNLLLNAAEAMPGGGRISIRTVLLGPPESGSGGRICSAEISDTGEGISKEDQMRLFEPFFTTKRDRKGVGLGLSVSKTIVENHQGYLQVESEPGKGTTVKVFLPLWEGRGEG